MTLPTAKEISKTNDPCCVACKRTGAEEAFRAVAIYCHEKAEFYSEYGDSDASAAVENLAFEIEKLLDGEKV